MTLTQLTTGQTACIKTIQFETAFNQRLQALGFRTGQSLTLLRTAPFNGPLHLRIGNTEVMLRHDEATHINVTL